MIVDDLLNSFQISGAGTCLQLVFRVKGQPGFDPFTGPLGGAIVSFLTSARNTEGVQNGWEFVPQIHHAEKLEKSFVTGRVVIAPYGFP